MVLAILLLTAGQLRFAGECVDLLHLKRAMLEYLGISTIIVVV